MLGESWIGETPSLVVRVSRRFFKAVEIELNRWEKDLMFLYAKTATRNEMEEFIKTHHYYTTEGVNYQKATTNSDNFIVDNAWTEFLPLLYQSFVFNKALSLRIEQDVYPLHQKWENAFIKAFSSINKTIVRSEPVLMLQTDKGGEFLNA